MNPQPNDLEELEAATSSAGNARALPDDVKTLRDSWVDFGELLETINNDFDPTTIVVPVQVTSDLPSTITCSATRKPPKPAAKVNRNVWRWLGGAGLAAAATGVLLAFTAPPGGSVPRDAGSRGLPPRGSAAFPGRRPHLPPGSDRPLPPEPVVGWDDEIDAEIDSLSNRIRSIHEDDADRGF